MLQFKNVLEIIEQSNWKKIQNEIYLINSVLSLKMFFEKEFPELNSLNLAIDVDDKELLDEVWDYKRPEFKRFIRSLGLDSFFYIKGIFTSGEINKKGVFLFSLVFIFKMKLETESIYCFKHTVQMHPNSRSDLFIIQEGLLGFRDLVIDELDNRYGEKYIISAREKEKGK